MSMCPSCGMNNPEGAIQCRRCGTPLASIHLPVGAKLKGGAYTVGKVLGQGGFGITYMGSDTRLRRPVAIKEFFMQGCIRRNTLVLPSTSISPEDFEAMKQRFLQEARILARFDHPNIVKVYDVFEENNTVYIIMQFLRGKPLSKILEERGRPLEEREAIGYVLQVCDALEVVHQAGLLHRDIKPDNIFVCDDGRAVLIDFGAAREFAARKTRRHTVILTPGYAPLEQYAEMAQRGPYTDIYALSATLYHLLTGEVPVPAPDRRMGEPLQDVRQLNPRVSPSVARAIMRGLEMNVEQRPQSVKEFRDLLQARVTPTPAHPITPTATSAVSTPHRSAVTYPNNPNICYWGHTQDRQQLKLCRDGHNYVCPQCCHERCRIEYPSMYEACRQEGWPVWPPSAAVSTPANLTPQLSDMMKSILVRLYGLTEKVHEEDMIIDHFHISPLEKNVVQNFSCKLEKGYLYLIISTGDDIFITDLDARIIAPDGKVLAEDTLKDNVPVLRFLAPQTGNYTIQVWAHEMKGERGFYALTTGHKITSPSERKVMDVWEGIFERFLALTIFAINAGYECVYAELDTVGERFTRTVGMEIEGGHEYLIIGAGDEVHVADLDMVVVLPDGRSLEDRGKDNIPQLRFHLTRSGHIKITLIAAKMHKGYEKGYYALFVGKV